MTIEALDAAQAERLRAAPLTYPRGGGPPTGYRRFAASRRLDRRDLDGAAADLLGWRMHERAGLRVAVSDPVARPGTVSVMRLGLDPAAARIPCRVVEVVEEPGRRGFAYGTLPGHPVSGEEWFVLEQRADGGIDLTIEAFSRPASLLGRLGGPLTRLVQEWMTRRYLRALDLV